MSHYFLCSQNKHSKNRRFFQCMVSDFVAAEFPKTPSPKPARSPPHTPPPRGGTAEAKRKILSPRKTDFRFAESVLKSHARGACHIICFGNRCELGTIETPEW